MAMRLNFKVASSVFLCLDQPMVIKTIAIMLINGCSTASKRAAEFYPPIPRVCMALKPLAETKYKIKPTNH